MKLKELFTDESKWTKGSSARDEAGLSVDPNHHSAICWCLRGGVARVLGDNKFSEVHDSNIHQAMLDKLGIISLISWNDAPERTFEDIKKLVEELDI